MKYPLRAHVFSFTVKNELPHIQPSTFYGEIHILDNPPAAGDKVCAFVTGVTDTVVDATISLTGSAICATSDHCAFAWDLDNDGGYDDATGASTNHLWTSPGDYTIGLQVAETLARLGILDQGHRERQLGGGVHNTLRK